MSLLRSALGARAALRSARAFSTTPARRDVTVPGGVNPTSTGPKFDAESELDSFTPPPRWSTKHVQPTDVVAGRAAGPATVHEDEKEITFDVISDAPKELRHRQVSRTIAAGERQEMLAQDGRRGAKEGWKDARTGGAEAGCRALETGGSVERGPSH